MVSCIYSCIMVEFACPGPDAVVMYKANSLSADNYPSADCRPTIFLDARCPQKVLPTVGGEHTHNDYIDMPTEKVVANMLATEESVCIWPYVDLAPVYINTSTRKANT